MAMAFTDAVPLSLSSMAHTSSSTPLTEGVLDGLKQVLQHTLLQCVNYANHAISPHQWSFRHLATSEFAWGAQKEQFDESERRLLQGKQFPKGSDSLQHKYSRNALIYLKPAISPNLTDEEEFELLKGWRHKPGILGRISLLYATTLSLTQEELDGLDTEDMPLCVLYKCIVEYRCESATGNRNAVQAEELSMLSFGGSVVDDDFKYGALASLYDKVANYVLEIYSVRGKRYKFDLMDSQLSNGEVPGFLSQHENDPFMKRLCVTVTDHAQEQNQSDIDNAITRMHLTMEGGLRRFGQENFSDDVPAFDHITDNIMASFLRLNPTPHEMVAANPSGHTLLLDPELAGYIFVNGRHITTWGQDPKIGSHGVALFGMDLQLSTGLVQNGRIENFEIMKFAYAQLWHEILVDARLQDKKIAKRLLYRLMRGQDPPDDDDDDDNLYDTDGEEDVLYPDIHKDTFESQVLAAPNYDAVGIAAKALAFNFANDFGSSSFPCLGHETEWVKKILPGRKPVVVPQRLINVLRRGGYFDAQKTADIEWFEETNPAQAHGADAEVVKIAVQFLEAAGCTDVDSENILFVASPVSENVFSKDAVCRWNSETEQFIVHQDFMTSPVEEFIGENNEERDTIRIRGYLLGMYIAKAHPLGKVLARYLVRNTLH